MPWREAEPMRRDIDWCYKRWDGCKAVTSSADGACLKCGQCGRKFDEQGFLVDDPRGDLPLLYDLRDSFLAYSRALSRVNAESGRALMERQRLIDERCVLNTQLSRLRVMLEELKPELTEARREQVSRLIDDVVAKWAYPADEAERLKRLEEVAEAATAFTECCHITECSPRGEFICYEDCVCHMDRLRTAVQALKGGQNDAGTKA